MATPAQRLLLERIESHEAIPQCVIPIPPAVRFRRADREHPGWGKDSVRGHGWDEIRRHGAQFDRLRARRDVRNGIPLQTKTFFLGALVGKF